MKKPKGVNWAYRINYPIPMLVGGGVVQEYWPGGEYYGKQTTGTPQQKGSNTLGNVAIGAAGALGNAALNYAQTGNAGGAVAGLVDTAIKSIPIAGQIVSAVDMVADPIANAFGNAASADPYNQTAKRFINPLNSLESGIENLINGNTSDGWIDLASVVIPGIGGVADANKAKEKARLEDTARFQGEMLNEKKRNIAEGRGGRYYDVNQMMQAAYGGWLDNNEDVQIGNPHLTSKFTPSKFNLSKTGVQGSWKTPMVKGVPYLQALDALFSITNILNEEKDIRNSVSPTQTRDKYERQHARERYELGDKSANTVKSMYDYGMLEEGGSIPAITEYNVGGVHDENMSGYGGIPVDAQGNKSIVSNAKPVATTEEGEITWRNPSTGEAYVFSNKIFKEI